MYKDSKTGNSCSLYADEEQNKILVAQMNENNCINCINCTACINCTDTVETTQITKVIILSTTSLISKKKN